MLFVCFSDQQCSQRKQMAKDIPGASMPLAYISIDALSKPFYIAAADTVIQTVGNPDKQNLKELPDRHDIRRQLTAILTAEVLRDVATISLKEHMKL